MRVLDQLYYTVCELNTYQLIERNSNDGGGQLEQLESLVRNLTEVVSRIVDRLDISDQDKLELIGCQYRFTPANDKEVF